MKVALVVAIAAAVVGLGTIAFNRAGDSRRRRFLDRERLTVEEFAARFYAGDQIPASVVEEALAEISMATDVDEGYLRPEDRFDGVLRPSKGWEYDDGLNLLGSNLSSRAAKAGIDLELSTIGCVDDYIRAFHRLCRLTENRLGSTLNS